MFPFLLLIPVTMAPRRYWPVYLAVGILWFASCTWVLVSDRLFEFVDRHQYNLDPLLWIALFTVAWIVGAGLPICFGLLGGQRRRP